MNRLMDDAPALSECPHCGHAGEGLQYAFANKPDGWPDLSRVQAACLSCGAHGAYHATYSEAAEAFQAGELEAA